MSSKAQELLNRARQPGERDPDARRQILLSGEALRIVERWSSQLGTSLVESARELILVAHETLQEQLETEGPSDVRP